MVVNIRYNVMCTNGESPHLIDTKMYLFHVEYQVRDAAADLVVHQDNVNDTAPGVSEMGSCLAISLDDTDWPVATVKTKQEENGGLGACP